MISPDFLIKQLRKSDEYIETIFLHGSCYRFHKFLKSIYPGAEAYINKGKNHVVTKIGSLFYDVTGVISPQKGEVFLPMDQYDHRKASKWSFAKNNYLKINECPNCEEPLII